MKRGTLLTRAGFTLVEVLIASAVLGASLIVMFGFHSQAVRSNMNARRLTDCTYLAQSQMERLLAVPWEGISARPTDLTQGYESDATMSSDEWSPLWWPTTKSEVNAANDTDATHGGMLYTVSWDVQNMDDDATWVRIRVRCTYEDAAFSTWHGTTISSFRFRDS